METSFQCIVIQVKDSVNDIDGYYLRDCLSEILDVEKHLHYVNEDQIIIKVPYYGECLGFSLNKLKEVVNGFTKATVYYVTVNIDYQSQKITNVYVM